MKRFHRLVIHPDYQGLGLGLKFLNMVRERYSEFRVTVVASSPSLIHAFKKSPMWKLKRQGRVTGGHGGLKSDAKASSARLTTTWEYPIKEARHER